MFWQNSDEQRLLLIQERPAVLSMLSIVTSWMSLRCALGGILEGQPLLGRFATVPGFFFPIKDNEQDWQ